MALGVLQLLALGLERIEALMVSRPGESRPQPLAERCGSLSTHTAPLKQTPPPSRGARE
jgi:hypothetical protein